MGALAWCHLAPAAWVGQHKPAHDDRKWGSPVHVLHFMLMAVDATEQKVQSACLPCPYCSLEGHGLLQHHEFKRVLDVCLLSRANRGCKYNEEIPKHAHAILIFVNVPVVA